jgi:hypothetical protein
MVWACNSLRTYVTISRYSTKNHHIFVLLVRHEGVNFFQPNFSNTIRWVIATILVTFMPIHHIWKFGTFWAGPPANKYTLLPHSFVYLQILPISNIELYFLFANFPSPLPSHHIIWFIVAFDTICVSIFSGLLSRLQTPAELRSV